jgi:hypothetical protein
MNTEQQTPQDGHAENVVRKRRITRYTHKQRKRFLKAFDQCGESQKDFCVARGINPGTFKGWLARRDKASAQGFAKVELPLPKVAPIEIAFPNGVRVAIGKQSNRDELIALIRGVAGC